MLKNTTVTKDNGVKERKLIANEDKITCETMASTLIKSSHLPRYGEELMQVLGILFKCIRPETIPAAVSPSK